MLRSHRLKVRSHTVGELTYSLFVKSTVLYTSERLGFKLKPHLFGVLNRGLRGYTGATHGSSYSTIVHLVLLPMYLSMRASLGGTVFSISADKPWTVTYVFLTHRTFLI